MNIVDALTFGGKIRRRKVKHEIAERREGGHFMVDDGWINLQGENRRAAFSKEDILACDWEVREQCRMISKKDIENAVDAYIRDPGPAVGIANGICRELGL